MSTSSKKKDLLEYKGHPLMRKENIIYYGSMSDSHIIMMQILESGEVKGMPVAKRVSVQLQQTAPNVRVRDRIVKKDGKGQPVGRHGHRFYLARPRAALQVTKQHRTHDWRSIPMQASKKLIRLAVSGRAGRIHADAQLAGHVSGQGGG